MLIVPSEWFLPIPLSERAEKQFCQNLGWGFFYHSPDYSHAIPQVEQDGKDLSPFLSTRPSSLSYLPILMIRII
jgi:hypothetical protein